MTTSPARPKADTTLWQRLPWVILTLALCLLAGALFNSGQGKQPALEWYAQSGLQQLEWDNYLSWLRFNGQGEQARRLEQQLSQSDRHAYAAALFAHDFVADSDARARDFWTVSQREQWKTLRSQVPAQLASSPLYRWGLTDQAPRLAHFFTAPLTGAPLWLTLLALALLVPLAAPLEQRIGHGKTLLVWIAGCLLAGGGYLLLAQPGQLPLHGAAPALLGLFGAAIASQKAALSLTLPGDNGKQLTLPAVTLWALPAALLGALSLQADPLLPTLCAGILALAGGALLVQILLPRESFGASSTEVTPVLTPTQQQELTRGWEALARLDGEAAANAFGNILESEPQQFDALTGQFTALQLAQEELAWQHLANTLFSHPADAPGQATQVSQCWKQFRQRSHTPIETQAGWQLVKTLTRAAEFQQAEALVEQLDDHESRKSAVRTLRQALEKEGLSHRAKALTR